MSEFKVTGKVEKIMPVVKGTSKTGSEWQKLEFVVKTDDEYNNIYCFEIFGEEKVEAFKKFTKTNDMVDVKFNVKCNEWKDKYYSSLAAWSVFKAETSPAFEPVEAVAETASDDLPF